MVAGKAVGETRYNAAGNVSLYMRYTFDESGNVVGISLWYPGDTVWTDYYFAKNLQGDVLAVYAASDNTCVAAYTYDSWGNILTQYGSLANTNPFRYRGYYYDNETGFYYLQSRYYDPNIGRFLNADSYASTGQGILGNNMFAYCGNNPITYSDTAGTARSLSMVYLNDPESLTYSAKRLVEKETKIGRRFVENDGKTYVTYDVSVSSERFERWKDNEYALSTVITLYSELIYAQFGSRIGKDEYHSFWIMNENHLYSELMAHVKIWFTLGIENTRIAHLNADEDRLFALVPMNMYGYDGSKCFAYKE